MNVLSKILLIGLILPFLVLTSCIKEEQYPLEPVIEYQGFAVVKDINGNDSIGMLSLTYTDGDGDIGLYDSDTAEPYKYNYYLRLFYMKNGSAVELVPSDPSLGFNARIPILTPAGKNKNIKGEINRDLELFYAWPLLETDTIGFEIYIKDRALHSSNIIQTPFYIIKTP
jgi:hypothetical protein